MGEPDYRAKQLFHWIHGKRAQSFDEMTDLSKALREKLSSDFYIGRILSRAKQCSQDSTRKYLFSLGDGELVETVAMYYAQGVTVCVSTQAGCRMGCVFCASAAGGFVRNLTASEMLLQVYSVAEDLNEKIAGVVLMGTGEPLDNFCNVMAFYDIITDKDGFGLSNRSVSLSTCGLADMIDLLADKKTQLTLSVSLHAADDELRTRLMPVNRSFSISRLMDSCRRYYRLTRRRISFEYMVIAGLNDGDDDAKKLAELMKGVGAHVNLIPANPVFTQEYTATKEQAEAFNSKLRTLGVNATVRRTLGKDIDAACGQLRRRSSEDMRDLSRTTPKNDVTK